MFSMSINEFIYYPILRPKRGELGALSLLDEITKDCLLPIFDLHRPEFDQRTNEYKKTFEKHIEDVCKEIRKQWKERCFAIDVQSFFGNLEDIKVKRLFALFSTHASDLNFVFVVSSNTNKYLLNLMQSLIEDSEHQVEFIMRLEREDFDDLEDTKTALTYVAKQLNIERDSFFLMLDFKNVENKDIDSVTDTITNCHEVLDLSSLSGICFSASSFPVDMANITKDTVDRVLRVEWKIWNDLQKFKSLLNDVEIKFSDYGISHPLKPEMDSSKVKAAGKIRYTVNTHWIISRGHKFKDDETENRNDQYQVLAKKLIREKDFIGKGYSWGDISIVDCANGGGKCGLLEKWVRIDMNHHFTFVTEQISMSFL